MSWLSRFRIGFRILGSGCVLSGLGVGVSGLRFRIMGAPQLLRSRLLDTLYAHQPSSAMEIAGLLFKELKLSYYNHETLLCTTYPYYGNFI